MYRFFFFLLIGLSVSVIVIAQTRLLTIGEATNMNPKLNAANLSQLRWMSKSENYCYIVRNTLIRGEVGSMKRDSILNLTKLNADLKDLISEPLAQFPSISFQDEKTILFSSGTKFIRYDLTSGMAEIVNSCDHKAENIDFEKQTWKIAFTRENNLYISCQGEERAITSENNKDIVYGSSRVHRNEFGIDKGTFWSPQGNFLAFYRMDETGVTDYPLVDITKRIAEVTPVKYPMAGMTSHKVTLGVYNISSGTTIYLRTDSSDIRYPVSEIEYLTNVTWSPDEKYIYIACLNRDQNHMQLNKYDAVSGNLVKTLFEEDNDHYVEPQHGPEFLNNDPSMFVWQSARDGFNHLYLYNAEGTLIRQLTHGKWVVQDFLKFDAENTRAWFYCNKDNPLDKQLYSVNLKKGDPVAITLLPGTHTAQISPDENYILDNYNSIQVSRQIEVLDKNGKKIQVLLENENPLKDYKLGKMSVFTIKAEENTDLFCRLIKPVDFDSTKKYPVIIYVYGGPHSQLITDSWLGGAGLFLNYLAEQGYVVFTLDNRGTMNRGRVFEQVIHRQVGTAELSDQMTGVRYLKSLPWVDSTRIGINGWSYGGFLTILMMLKNPGTFKVAVCGGPVTDWRYYEVMYGERYMDTPESNPEGYNNACLLNNVKNLQGKLLIIHDYQDETVVPQNSLVFLKKCVDEGKQLDYFIYPGHEHNVRGKDRVHLNQKMVQYFNDYL
jgi:dipeptidyl-peptidase 4